MATQAGVRMEFQNSHAENLALVYEFFETSSFGLPRLGTYSTVTAGFNSLWNGLEPSQSVAGGNEAAGRAAALNLSTPASQITEIRELSGLTIDQIGRLFGVSRRSIHNWMNGRSMASHHEEHAARILSTVQSLSGETPGERRLQLLAARAEGSIFQQLRAGAKKNVTLQVAAISPRDQLQL